MKQQPRENLGLGKPLLTLLFSSLMLVVLFSSLPQKMRAGPRAPSLKTSAEGNRPRSLDYMTGVSTCEQTENLVPNPGFEEGSQEPGGWEPDDWLEEGDCDFYYDDLGHDEGGHSARIWTQSVRDKPCKVRTASGAVPVEEGRWYDYAAWIKAQPLNGDTYLCIRFQGGPPDYGGKGLVCTTPVADTDGAWALATGSAEAPPGAEYARVEATLPASSEGVVWFDDLFVGLATCLGINKRDHPDPVERGQVLTFTIAYSNTGREKATDVEIIETYDEYVGFVSAQPPPFAGTSNLWKIPELPPGISDTITVVVRVEDETGDRAYLFNDVQILSDETVAPVYTTISTTIVPPPDGCAFKIHVPDAEKQGTPSYPTDYELILENAGSCDGLADLVATSSQRWEVTIAPPPPYTLPAGSIEQVTVSTMVPSCELSGTVDVTTITATLDCEVPCNKTVTETTAVTTTVKRAFGVEIGPSRSINVSQGEIVSLTHTVRNVGNDADTYDFTAHSEQGWSLSPPSAVTLGPCGSSDVSLTVTVPHTAAPGMSDTIIVTATSQGDPSIQDSVADTLSVTQERVYLPLVAICHCPPNAVENSCFVSPCDFAPWWGDEGGLRRKVVARGEDDDNPFGCCTARLGDPAYDNNSGEIPIDDRATIFQSIVVPNTSSPALEFTYAMYSYHILKGGVTGRLFDSFEVAIDDPDNPDNVVFQTGNPEGQVPDDCRHTVWQSGVQSKSVDLAPYAGDTITVYFSVWNRIHGGCNTWAYIDSVRMVP